MSKYLRDEFLKNLSLNESKIQKINDAILEIAHETNSRLTQTTEAEKDKLVLPSYIIRFDNKGFLLYDFNKVLKYFKEARKVERVIFILDFIESYVSNKQRGKCLELRFDKNDINNCYLSVQDDRSDWVDASFCKIKELLERYKNKNYLIRNNWTNFIVQISGVFAGFILSLWVAYKISPFLTIDYPFVVTFILTFLLFSNAWTFINPLVFRLLDYYWPNISFKDIKGFHWLIKALISAVFVGFSLLVLNKLFIYIGTLLKGFVK